MKQSKVFSPLAIILNFFTSKGESETFVSESGWFKFDKPKEWIYEREDKDTYSFHNESDWKGSLRISPYRFTGAETEVQIEKVDQYVNDELNEQEDAKRISLGDKEVVFYSKIIDSEEDVLQIDYLVFGIENTLFLCSFTIDNKEVNDLKVKKGITLYRRALESLLLNDQ
ncbi:DUF3805 domain-containing protein [Puteibacter caeruleilacunae]|nr:DUF3805 domain-containing protein [Puteibacter caeruleilacunae]